MLQFLNMQRPCRCGTGSLAMPPCRLEPIEPRTLARHGAHDYTPAAMPLDTTVVRLQPRPYGSAAVPRGMVPHHQECRFPCRRQPCRQPRKTLRRHRTDRTTVHPAEEHGRCGSASQPITRDRLGLWGMAVRRMLAQAQRLVRCPGLQVGLGEAAPPAFLLPAQAPLGMPYR